MTALPSCIGFMQGRLSPLIDGKIQAFPRGYWQDEFLWAREAGLSCMEWTLDQEQIYENPLMTATGRAEIRALAHDHSVRIPSVTADCCMQAPFWKAAGHEQDKLIAIFEKLLLACADIGICRIVVPLVDNGALTSVHERETLEKIVLTFMPLLEQHNLIIAFESDFAPAPLAALIAGLPAAQFGINYDMGNSASLGWDTEEEFALLAPRIVNVHVKDRVRGGTTVPLGQGGADFPKIFGLLRKARYAGNYILQTARAADGKHVEAIYRYATFVAGQIGDARAA
jgi:hexulose-6-phosphate isomerase